MISTLCPFLVISFMASTCSGADATTVSSGKAIAIARLGSVDDEIFQRILDYVRTQYDVAVRVKELAGTVETDEKDLISKLASCVDIEDVCLLVLAGHGWSPERELTIAREKRIAVLDTTSLQPRQDDAPEKEEQYGERVEKESLRAIALAIGMSDCPFPRCALLPHRNEAELDLKSRNPCPPCLTKIRQRLRELGATSAGKIRETLP